MAFLLLRKKAENSSTISKIESGKNNAVGTFVPAIVPKKAKASESANVRITDGIYSLDAVCCGYNFSSPHNCLILKIYEEVVKMFHFF